MEAIGWLRMLLVSRKAGCMLRNTRYPKADLKRAILGGCDLVEQG